jgi:hypothetical protein
LEEKSDTAHAPRSDFLLFFPRTEYKVFRIINLLHNHSGYSCLHPCILLFFKLWNLKKLEVQKIGSMEPVCQNGALASTWITCVDFRPSNIASCTAAHPPVVVKRTQLVFWVLTFHNLQCKKSLFLYLRVSGSCKTFL